MLILLMPNCRYIVLSYHPTETSERGQLLVLLLEYSEKSHKRNRQSYLLSDLATITDEIERLSTRGWIISALGDIVREQSNHDLSTDKMFGCYSCLNVGPLRTTRTGSFDCESLSEAFASIKAGESSGDDLGALSNFPDLLLPLNDLALSPFQDTLELQLRRDA
jgi:hypothetical protein